MGKAKPYLAGTQPLSDLLLLHQDQYHVFNDWVQSHCMLTPLEHTVHLKKNTTTIRTTSFNRRFLINAQVTSAHLQNPAYNFG